MGSGTIGKLITSAGGALITAFLTAPGRHHPRRIVAVGLVLALLNEGKALAAAVRRPRARHARPSVFPRPAGLFVTAAVAVIGFSAGWVVVTSPFVASPSSGESAVNVAMRVATTPAAPTHRRSHRRPSAPRVASASAAATSSAAATKPTTSVPTRLPVAALPSSGPTLVVVPSVAGQTLAAAQKSLQGVGFTTSTSSQPSPKVASGMVISSDPPGGSRAPSGSSVQIVVSSGPTQVAVPDVTGMPVKQALGDLQSRGFAPVVSLQPTQAVASGDVIATTPAAGALAAPGSPVTVIVSS